MHIRLWAAQDVCGMSPRAFALVSARRLMRCPRMMSENFANLAAARLNSPIEAQTDGKTSKPLQHGVLSLFDLLPRSMFSTTHPNSMVSSSSTTLKPARENASHDGCRRIRLTLGLLGQMLRLSQPSGLRMNQMGNGNHVAISTSVSFPGRFSLSSLRAQLKILTGDGSINSGLEILSAAHACWRFRLLEWPCPFVSLQKANAGFEALFFPIGDGRWLRVCSHVPRNDAATNVCMHCLGFSPQGGPWPSPLCYTLPTLQHLLSCSSADRLELRQESDLKQSSTKQAAPDGEQAKDEPGYGSRTGHAAGPPRPRCS